MGESTIGKNLSFTLISALLLCGCESSQEHTAPLVVASAVASARTANAEEMINGVHYPGLSGYYALMKESRYWDARNFLIIRLKASDPAIKQLIADAEIKEYLKDINDPTTPKSKKDKALIDLAYTYPEQAKPFANLVKQAQIDSEKEKEARESADDIKRAVEMDKSELLLSKISTAFRKYDSTALSSFPATGHRRGLYDFITKNKLVFTQVDSGCYSNCQILAYITRKSYPKKRPDGEFCGVLARWDSADLKIWQPTSALAIQISNGNEVGALENIDWKNGSYCR